MATPLSCQQFSGTHGIASEAYLTTEANGRRIDQRATAVEWEVTAGDLGEMIDWTENTTAEDNGHEAIITGAQAGALDATEGVVYNGQGTHVVVKLNAMTLGEGTIISAEEDLVTMALFRNSEVVWMADEGFITMAEEIAVDMNFDTDPIPVVTNDVLRLCIVQGLNAPGDAIAAAEDGIGWELTEEDGDISVISVA